MPIDRRNERMRVTRVFRLGQEAGDDLSAHTTAAERIAMMWPLALEAWSLSGRDLPEYERSEMPIRVRRLEPPARRPRT